MNPELKAKVGEAVKSLKDKIVSIVPTHGQVLGKRTNVTRDDSQDVGQGQQIQDRGEFVDSSDYSKRRDVKAHQKLFESAENPRLSQIQNRPIGFDFNHQPQVTDT